MTLMSTQYRKLVWCILPALVASVLVLVGSSVVSGGQQRGPRRPGAAPLIPGNGPRDFDAQWSPANPQIYADWKFPDDVIPPDKLVEERRTTAGWSKRSMTISNPGPLRNAGNTSV